LPEPEVSTIPWDSFFNTVETAVASLPSPSVNEIEAGRSEPWDVLVSTIISLRTKDAVTLEASRRLLSLAPGPAKLMELDDETVAGAVYPAGFYRTKAANLRKIADILLRQYGGEVPSSRELLLALPGVGLKTANLVLSVGFGIPAICVDIHVHRIANRRAWIETRNPDASEEALRKILPERWWIDINRLLVGFGQSVCVPVSPHCSRCPVGENCPRIGVGRSR
jgi:endonuclease-3